MESNQPSGIDRQIQASSMSISGVNTYLYIECLEEASFLYEHRLAHETDSDVFWPEIEDLEIRFDAYIDLLVLGNDLAIAVCRQQATEGDFGELHAAIRVFCRQDKQDLIVDVLDELDFEDEERVKAVSDALCYELPESWQDEFLDKLLEKDYDCSLIAVNVIAFKRLDYSEKLYEILLNKETPKELLIAIFHAIGRIRPKFKIDNVLDFLSNEDKGIVDSAVNALIRIGDYSVLSNLKSQIIPEDFPKISAGLWGNKDSVNNIILKPNSEGEKKLIHKDYILAAGLIGNTSIILNLIESLSIDALSENVSLALNLITGAELYENHFIPEEINEDMLFEDELEKYYKGELYAPGEEPGETITRLSQNTETWQNWWNDNNQNFDPDIRYRNGKPYSPECLIENLKSEKSPDIIRKLAHEELVIRYSIEFPFETEMLVKDQIVAIEQYENWLEANPDKFAKGKWYFHGKLI